MKNKSSLTEQIMQKLVFDHSQTLKARLPTKPCEYYFLYIPFKSWEVRGY